MRRIFLAIVLVAFLAVPSTGTVVTSQVTVTTAATVLVVAVPFSQDVAISNRGTGADMYIGPAGVTTSNGFKLVQDATLSITAFANTAIYGIVAAATEPAHVIILR